MSSQSDHRFGALFVDGGPSRNRFLMQCVADILGHAVIQREAPEVSALGAAYLAGLFLGFCDMTAISLLPGKGNLIQPETNVCTERLKTWDDAIARSTFRPSAVKCE
jgi:glycerol kinase